MTSLTTRSKARTRLLWASPLVLLVALAAAPARAADLTPAQKLEMKQLYEKATRAYDVGKYNEAIEDYQKAYEIGGDPPMLYNIAQAYRLNDQPTEALRFYRRYIQRAPSARNREDVERKIAELEKIVEERRKTAAAATPPPVTTPPLTTPPKETPAPTPPPPAPNPPVTATVTATPETPAPAPAGGGGGRVLRIVGWSAIGVAVAAGAVATITGLMARSKGQDLTNSSNNGEVFNPDVEHSGKVLNNMAIGFGIGAGVVAVAGAVLVIVGSSGSSSETASPESTPPPATTPPPTAMVTPWLGNGLVGAGAALRF
jgi:hypothetical protein